MLIAPRRAHKNPALLAIVIMEADTSRVLLNKNYKLWLDGGLFGSIWCLCFYVIVYSIDSRRLGATELGTRPPNVGDQKTRKTRESFLIRMSVVFKPTCELWTKLEQRRDLLG